MSNPKPRSIRSYDKLDDELIEQIKLAYPTGFAKHLIRFTDVDGSQASALPFETEDKYLLIRMSKKRAVEIIENDDDYDDDGLLLDDVRDEYAEKHEDDDDFDAADIDPNELADDEDARDDDED